MPTQTELEEQIAHLSKTLEELSDVVAAQDKDITFLRAQLLRLTERDAERELDAGGSAVFVDQKPPHY